MALHSWGVFYCTYVTTVRTKKTWSYKLPFNNAMKAQKYMKLFYDWRPKLESLGCTSVYDWLLACHLQSLAEINGGDFGYFRYKDLQQALGTSRPTISKSLNRLKAANLLQVDVSGFGAGQQSNFKIRCKEALQQIEHSCKAGLQTDVKEVYTCELSSFTTDCKAGLQTTIDSNNRLNTIDNTDMSVLQAKQTATPKTKTEVETLKTESEHNPTSAVDVITQKKEKKKVAPKKKDHPDTDRLLDKLMLVFDEWPLPRQPIRDRESMRKLLTGQRPTPPETINRLIDYLHWRGYDKEVRQNLDGRHPCEIRSVRAFTSKMDKLHAEMEHARMVHSGSSQRQAQNNAKRQEDIQRYLQDRDYLDSPEGKAAVAQLEREFDGL